MRAKIVWSIIFIWFFLMAFLFFTASARSENITLQWDHSGDPVADGFHIFSRIAGGQYDYNSPMETIEYPDGNIPADVRAVTIELEGEPDNILKYEFVARAFVTDLNSEDSNQVDYTVVRIPPPKALNLSGEFDRQNSIIKIQWDQPQDDYLVNHWRVYYKDSDQGPESYSELGLIRKDNPLELTTEFNIVENGEQKNIDFVVVSYRRSGVWSGNSQTLTLNIDRRIVSPVENLRINIEIPVI